MFAEVTAYNSCTNNIALL